MGRSKEVYDRVQELIEKYEEDYSNIQNSSENKKEDIKELNENLGIDVYQEFLE